MHYEHRPGTKMSENHVQLEHTIWYKRPHCYFPSFVYDSKFASFLSQFPSLVDISQPEHINLYENAFKNNSTIKSGFENK